MDDNAMDWKLSSHSEHARHLRNSPGTMLLSLLPSSPLFRRDRLSNDFQSANRYPSAKSHPLQQSKGHPFVPAFTYQRLTKMESVIDALEVVEETKEMMSDPPVFQYVIPESEGKLELQETENAGIPVDQVNALSPFRRWLDGIRIKKKSFIHQPQRHIDGWPSVQRPSSDNSSGVSPYHGSQEQQLEEISSNSSHLGRVQTTTASIASQSIVRSRRTTQSTTNQSTKSDVRSSIDSLRPALSTSAVDEAQNRAVRRRQILQEIITTESDYIFGLKALADVLLYIAARPEIYHNVQRIRETHESFLKRVRQLTPTSNLSATELERLTHRGAFKRSHTGDSTFKALQNRSLRTHNFKASIDHRLKELAAEANEALAVAREIGSLSRSFVYYKEFCKNYELLVEDTALLRKSVPNWPAFEQGIEALTKSGASIETRALYEHKSLCFSDLLIKPAQRLCKYPLLLQELLQWTHIQDDPSAHDEIRQVLESVREVLAGINEATTNTLNRAFVEKTFLLQEMIEFEFGTAVDIFKQLGPMVLCGVLHVTYQASRRLIGAFMVCVLFKYHFLLAKMNEEYRKLRPVACLYISDLKLDSLKGGNGVEYICLFAWKLVFQYRGKKFELVLSASCAAEEKQWKTGILKSAAASAEAPSAVSSELRESSFLVLDPTPVEEGSDLTPQLSRKSSLHSLTVPRGRSGRQPVIIRKTHSSHKHCQNQQVDGEVERPKVPPPYPPPYPAVIFTARRQDRIRLERAVFPIYTRDALPYPGMSLAAGEILSGSIMRHLSIRSKRYRRSSSVNLPTTLRNLGDPEDIDRVDDKMQCSSKRKTQEVSEGIGPEAEKDRMSQRDNTTPVGRSKIQRPKSSAPQPGNQEDRSQEHNDTFGLKTIRSIFSLRRSKKSARPKIGGAW